MRWSGAIGQSGSHNVSPSYLDARGGLLGLMIGDGLNLTIATTFSAPSTGRTASALTTLARAIIGR